MRVRAYLSCVFLPTPVCLCVPPPCVPLVVSLFSLPLVPLVFFVTMDSTSVKFFPFLSWNARGLGDGDKCGVVKNAILATNPVVACLQEMKLDSLDKPKIRSFLPPVLSEFTTLDAVGTRGGLVTAWDPRRLSLVSTSSSTYSLTTCLASTSSDLPFVVTNINAPSDHSLIDAFVEDVL